MQKGCTPLEAVTGDEYGGKVRIVGVEGGEIKIGPKACFLIHLKFPCSIHSSSAGGGHGLLC
jgi:hypothetical protein